MNNQNVLEKEVSNKISFIMIVFIIIIVLFHSNFRYYYSFIEDLTAIANSYFFCVSSFFFYRSLNDKSSFALLKKRFITLIIPYLLWNLTYTILYMETYDFTFEIIIRGFTVNPFCLPSWYLLTLFIFFLPAFFVKRALNKMYSTIILLSFGVSVSYCGYIIFQEELASIPVIGGYLIRMSEYFTPYLIGGIIGTWFKNHIYTNFRKNILGIIGSCLIIFLLLHNAAPGIRWLLWVIFPLSLWNSIPEKIFNYMGFLHWVTEPGFFINMVHCYFLYLWSNVIIKYFNFTDKRSTLLNVIFTLITSYVLYYLFKLFMPKVLHVFTGNRLQNKNYNNKIMK